jgi:nucleoid DNA-binding protein
MSDYKKWRSQAITLQNFGHKKTERRNARSIQNGNLKKSIQIHSLTLWLLLYSF